VQVLCCLHQPASRVGDIRPLRTVLALRWRGYQRPSDSATLSPGEQANADFADQLSGEELLSALQEGGQVIYIGHTATEVDYADQADPNMSLDDCEI